MRKIIAYLATSADGFIARKDGSVDWLDRPRPRGGYGYAEFVRSIDTILVGRNTYDFAVKMGGAPPMPGVHKYVFTSRPANALPDFEAVHGRIKPFIKRLRATPGKNIWMMGGGSLISSFLDAGGIDEFSIHIVPVLIGEGIPLIAPKRRNINLKLVSTRKYPDGVVHVHYKI